MTPLGVRVVATLAGIVRPNDLVTRDSLIGETIPADHQVGAVGLSRASVARGRPAPDPSTASRGAPSRPSPYRDLKEGLVHVVNPPMLLAAMARAFLVNLSAYPLTSSPLPYVARSIYGVDATGLGWLVATYAFGALVGSLTIVVTGGSRCPERSMVIYTIVWYALLLGFGHARSLGLEMGLPLVIGFVQSIAMISLMATLLARTESRFRAHVMGARTLAVYGMPSD